MLASTGTGALGYNMFAYCNNSPVCFADPTGDRFVGIGVQLELTIGSYTCGIEFIIYWDKTVCKNGGPVLAIYVYEGASFSVSSEILNSPNLMNTINQLSLAIAANGGKDYDTLMLIELQALLFSTEVSGSVVGIWGYDDFDSVEDYEGKFTSYSGSFHHFKGTYSYADKCCAVAIGGTTGWDWSISFAQTNYTLIYSGDLFSMKGAEGNGGGYGAYAARNSVSFCYAYCL